MRVCMAKLASSIWGVKGREKMGYTSNHIYTCISGSVWPASQYYKPAALSFRVRPPEDDGIAIMCLLRSALAFSCLGSYTGRRIRKGITITSSPFSGSFKWKPCMMHACVTPYGLPAYSFYIYIYMVARAVRGVIPGRDARHCSARCSVLANSCKKSLSLDPMSKMIEED